MVQIDLQKLRLLIKQKEGTKLDFKETLNLDTESQKKEFAKDIIAIANSTGGRGYIIVGIKDKVKDVVGIKPSEFIEERIQQIISYRCDPPVNIRVETVKYTGSDIGVVTIFKSQQRPHQMRQTGAFYIRRGSTTDFARRDEIAGMFQEGGLISNELVPLYNLDIEVLNESAVNKYLKKMGIALEMLTEMELWSSLGIVVLDGETGKYHPTIGGLLLFCDNPQIFLPYCSITIILVMDNKKTAHVMEGNIMNVLQKSSSFIERILKQYDYPADAIGACIGNAVVHRDYFDISRDIVVYISPNKIEISNPGTLPKGNNIHMMMRESNPSRRNNWLYHRLLVLDDENRFLRTGFNLQGVVKKFEGIGKVKFLNLEKRNLFKAILPGYIQIKGKKS